MPIKAVLPGFPVYEGSHKVSIIDLRGPASYVNGTGELLYASMFGEGGIEFADFTNLGWVAITQNGTATYQMVALSMSGTYFVVARFGTGTVGVGVSYITLKWYVTGTGAEVGNGVDLSSEYVRIRLWMV